MVVCKYFMDGYCKYGVRCKFDHVEPYRGYDSSRSADYSSERPQGTSILKAATSSFGHSQQSYDQTHQHSFSQHSFSSPHSYNQTPQHAFTNPQKPSGMKYNVQEIMQIVLRDITQLEKGGQWQLSCYSPLKELPNMPGLEDYSPEELRWECYKALQNGSLPLCQVIVQQLYGNVAKIINELKRKDSGYSIIDRWLQESEQQRVQTKDQPSTIFSSPFVGSSVTEPPTQQAQPASISFSLQQQQQPQPYQQNNPLFLNSQASPVFSSNQNTSPSPPIFPSNQSTSAFASPLSVSRTLVDNQAYSAKEALTEAELVAFQADRFVLGSIPIKPPPRMFCNM
ncbi:nucleoporin NUP42-like isoform X1 [Macrosteles quadrilineatus]|uniref:nucleoporin NUP42-like isoform X1 n=1 Tax=Macrosteles quadrilineatus TaxID=74068 RepID=UPI0023E129A5|nr:nucleoporin NUP42-like isoform X1 [Macrosteles quadrilineatus]